MIASPITSLKILLAGRYPSFECLRISSSSWLHLKVRKMGAKYNTTTTTTCKYVGSKYISFSHIESYSYKLVLHTNITQTWWKWCASCPLLAVPSSIARAATQLFLLQRELKSNGCYLSTLSWLILDFFSPANSLYWSCWYCTHFLNSWPSSTFVWPFTALYCTKALYLSSHGTQSGLSLHWKLHSLSFSIRSRDRREGPRSGLLYFLYS